MTDKPGESIVVLLGLLDLLFLGILYSKIHPFLFCFLQSCFRGTGDSLLLGGHGSWDAGEKQPTAHSSEPPRGSQGGRCGHSGR